MCIHFAFALILFDLDKWFRIFSSGRQTKSNVTELQEALGLRNLSQFLYSHVYFVVLFLCFKWNSFCLWFCEYIVCAEKHAQDFKQWSSFQFIHCFLFFSFRFWNINFKQICKIWEKTLFFYVKSLLNFSLICHSLSMALHIPKCYIIWIANENQEEGGYVTKMQWETPIFLFFSAYALYIVLIFSMSSISGTVSSLWLYVYKFSRQKCCMTLK